MTELFQFWKIFTWFASGSASARGDKTIFADTSVRSSRRCLRELIVVGAIFTISAAGLSIFQTHNAQRTVGLR